MTGGMLRAARLEKGWTQAQAAREFGVSQGYVALLEAEDRLPSEALKLVMVRKLGLPPTAVTPVEGRSANAERLAADLADLGYPGFAHLARARRVPRNPAAVLLDALQVDQLEARAVEALPWLVATFSDFDWDWLVPRAKALDLQNRLGFVVTLARELAERSKSPSAETLRARELGLERSRLVREDAFGRSSMTEAERRWLRANRPESAARWNVLSNLTAEHLQDVDRTP
jgi:transcriptional regulator with XRE-family HTH domain